MIEGGQDFGLALEAGQAFRVAADGAGQDLDGYGTLEVGIGGAIHLAHAAGPNLLGYLVGTDSRTFNERHALGPTPYSLKIRESDISRPGRSGVVSTSFASRVNSIARTKWSPALR